MSIRLKIPIYISPSEEHAAFELYIGTTEKNPRKITDDITKIQIVYSDGDNPIVTGYISRTDLKEVVNWL